MLRRKSSKRLVLGIVLFVFTLVQQVPAQQLKLPRVSPEMKVVGTIGLTKVAVMYSSPAVRGREIWGKLVPFGLTKFGFGGGNPAPWRAGANENSIIYFGNDVKINGNPLPAGKYGLHMIVSETEWTVIFSKNTSSWGSFFYDEADDALRIKVTPAKAEFKERLTYGFENFKPNSADVFLHWEKLKVKFNVEVETDALVLQSIKDQLRGIIGFTWQSYHQAGGYCLRANKHLDQGLKWLKKSIQMNENATNRNTLGYLLMAMNKKDDSIKVFRENIKKYPTNWNVFDSLGENLVKIGQKKEGIKYYKLALKKSPSDRQKKRIEGVLKKLQGK